LQQSVGSGDVPDERTELVGGRFAAGVEQNDPLHAPTLIHHEIASALTTRRAVGLIEPEHVSRAWTAVPQGIRSGM
jgi:hypothetical protein